MLLLVLDFMYCSTRTMMLATAYIWPESANEALDMPSRALNHPWAAKSITQLWRFRWPQLLRFYTEGMCYKALEFVLPKGKAMSPAVRASSRTVVAFTMSGLIHEYVLWAAFGKGLRGLNMAFFGLNGAAVLLETWVPAAFRAVFHPQHQHQRRRSQSGTPKYAAAASGDSPTAASTEPSHWYTRSPVLRQCMRVARVVLGHAWALSVMVVLSPLFVEPYRVAGTFGHRAFHPLGVPVTPAVISWISKRLAQG